MGCLGLSSIFTPRPVIEKMRNLKGLCGVIKKSHGLNHKILHARIKIKRNIIRIKGGGHHEIKS
jgi:hypothetical protein